MADKPATPIHVFIDHSNMWGSARLASKVRQPDIPDALARISVRNLDLALGGRREGVTTKVVSGGVPPGMEGLWAEYARNGYDTQRLFRDEHWREHGVDHSIIGHMWRLLALQANVPTILVLASGDGKENEFGTSFHEVLREILGNERYASWKVELASYDWNYPNPADVRPPTSSKMRRLVEGSPRGKFINLMDSYDNIVYHEKLVEKD